MNRGIRKGAAWGVLVGFLVLAGCDLSETVDVPTQPGVVPGSKAEILAQGDWDDGRIGTVGADSADWFRLELKKDSMYSITAEVNKDFGSGSTDLKVEVFGSVAYQVWAQGVSSGTSGVARVVFASPLTGYVRIRVSKPSRQYGRYAAIVRREDSYEKDDIRSAAGWIVAGASVQKRMISDLDTDWVAISTVSGKYYELYTDRSGLDIQTFHEDGGMLLCSFGIESTGNGRNWGFTGDGGTVYARVSKEATTSVEGAYTLGLRRIDDDSREPDDTAKSAAKIGFGTTYSGILLPFTEDWLQFAGAVDQGYKVKITSDEPLDIRVVDSVGYVHGTRTSTESAEIRFAPWTVQPVYVQIFNSTQVAKYSVSVTKFDTTVVHSTVAEEGNKQGPI